MLATVATTLGATARHAEGTLVVLLLRGRFLRGLCVDSRNGGGAGRSVTRYPFALTELEEILYDCEL